MGFQKVGAAQDVLPGTVREITLQEKAIALVNVEGKFHAVNNICPHRGAPLSQGWLEGNTLTCPWHGWEFDVRTGKICQNANASVECYPVEVRNGEIYVDPDKIKAPVFNPLEAVRKIFRPRPAE